MGHGAGALKGGSNVENYQEFSTLELEDKISEAAQSGDIETLQRIMTFALSVVTQDYVKAPSFNKKDAHGFTPLAYAAMKGHENICDALLSSGMITLNLNSDPEPLLQAAQNYHFEICKKIYNSGIKYHDSHLVDKVLRVVFDNPKYSKDEETNIDKFCYFMLSRGHDTRLPDIEPSLLSFAAEHQNFYACQMLSQHGSKLDQEILEMAQKFEDLKIYNLLAPKKEESKHDEIAEGKSSEFEMLRVKKPPHGNPLSRIASQENNSGNASPGSIFLRIESGGATPMKGSRDVTPVRK